MDFQSSLPSNSFSDEISREIDIERERKRISKFSTCRTRNLHVKMTREARHFVATGRKIEAI